MCRSEIDSVPGDLARPGGAGALPYQDAAGLQAREELGLGAGRRGGRLDAAAQGDPWRLGASSPACFLGLGPAGPVACGAVGPGHGREATWPGPAELPTAKGPGK
jgi:hypothetical protein